jgi:diaminopimelate decarboxylase
LSGAPTPQIVEPGTAALLAEAAERFTTPCYVTDLRVLDQRAGELGAEFPDPWIRQYSLKANPLPAVVARLAESGFGANVVSSGEWAAATAAGLGNDLITLEGIGKTDDDLEAAVAAATRGRPLRWVTLESPEEADRLSGMTKAAGLDQAPNGLDVLLRLNPEVVPETSIDLCVGAKSSKFGMTRAEIGEWVESNRRSPSGLVVRGIHVRRVTAQSGRGVDTGRDPGMPSAEGVVAGLDRDRHGRFRRRLPLRGGVKPAPVDVSQGFGRLDGSSRAVASGSVGCRAGTLPCR